MKIVLLSLGSFVLGCLSAGRYLGLHGASMGWDLGSAPAAALAVAAVLGAMGCLAWSVGRRSGDLWAVLAAGGVFLLLALSPSFEALRFPDPQNLVERKRQVLFAALAAGALVLAIAVQLAALRHRLKLGRGAGAWPVILPMVWLLAHSVWTTRWNMTGDAPHYLLITHSLVEDGDIDLKDDYADGSAAAFYPRMPLLPQERVVDGRQISWHKPGLPAILAPAYRAAGPWAAIGLLCVLGGLLGGALWALLGAAGIGVMGAWQAWAALMLSPPFLTQGAMVLSECTAALLLTLALWGLWRLPARGGAAAFAFATALLPWLNARFFIFLPVLALALFLRAGFKKPGAWAGFLAAAGSLAAYNLRFFGSPWPTGGLSRVGVEGVPFFSLSYAKQALLGQLWDQEFGLAFGSPLWLFAIVGLVWGLRRGKGLALAAFLLFAMNYLVLSVWLYWTGQLMPNRFYTPLLPVYALGLAWSLEAGKGPAYRRAWNLAALAGAGLAWAYIALPWLAFNRGDGANWIVKLMPGPLRRALAQALPSFQAPGPRPQDLALGLLLTALLTAAILRYSRKGRHEAAIA